MLDRRQFLQHSSLISLTPWIPSFLPGTLSADDSRKDDAILVVIQLDGGNDGLNTVIPFADDGYAKYRNTLRIAEKKVIKLNDSIGLHPSMRDFAKLFEEGYLSIAQGVGYPNPNRSHFESMSIWHRARLEEQNDQHDGWLGRAYEAFSKTNNADTASVSVGDDSIPLALRSARSVAISLNRESDLRLTTPVEPQGDRSAKDSLTAFITRTQDQSFKAAREFDQSMDSTKSTAEYAGNELARHLKLVSRLIKTGCGARIFYTIHSGYDTHNGQAPAHADLLRDFSGAVRAFLTDLRESKLDDRVVLLAFSEFGRRVQENGSAGTDHGAAGPVFLAGTPVRGGIIGEHPSLTDLDQGDLKMLIDFRSVYSTLLTQWLKLDASRILGGDSAPINALRGSA